MLLFSKDDFIGDERLIDTHIKNIRKKAGADIIETIRGVGYRIAKENKEYRERLCDIVINLQIKTFYLICFTV